MNLLNLKNRIRSVKNIGQATKAMELVAASKMRKAQQRSIEAKRFSEELNKLMISTTHGLDTTEFDLLKQNKSQKKLLIIIGPSKGSVGPLISNLAKEVYKFLQINPDTDLISIDKKGNYIAQRSGKKVISSLNEVKTTIQEYEIEPIIEIIKDGYIKLQYSSIHIIYSHFINTLNQKAKLVDLLPIMIEENNKSVSEDILIEPNKRQVIEQLLNKYLDNKLFICILNSISSEYSARMIAMKNASDNAKDLKEDLTQEYNQSRQAAITQQILEIAGAVTAMGS